MNKRTFAMITAVITFIVGVAIAKLSFPSWFKTPAPRVRKEIQLSNYRISGPYEFESLSIFLIHGPNVPNSAVYTPLQDAMARDIVTVYETGTVNELVIENVSANEDVFVQAGDIVKGGRQDRVLSVDAILPAKSGSIPVSSFCVEQSRWQQRGSESADHFTLTEMVATHSLQQAIKDIATQAGVWAEVKSSQDNVGAGVARSVRSDESPTSLPLALASEAVQEAMVPYLNYLSTITHGQSNVIGFAFAINDELKAADVYSSNRMFELFWPRLLKSAVIETIGTPAVKQTSDGLAIESVGEFLVNSEMGTETISNVNSRTQSVKRETNDALFFESRDVAHGGAWIHRSYLLKRK